LIIENKRLFKSPNSCFAKPELYLKYLFEKSGRIDEAGLKW
jgi:hypothetical protein